MAGYVMALAGHRCLFMRPVLVWGARTYYCILFTVKPSFGPDLNHSGEKCPCPLWAALVIILLRPKNATESFNANRTIHARRSAHSGLF